MTRAAGAALLAVGLVASAAPASATPTSAQPSLSTAVKKQITCYKGTTAKKFTAKKCPKGWSPKKPATKAGTKTISLNATYKGNITMLWSASDVKATELTGTTSDAGAFGLTTMAATGASAPQSQCAAITGDGVLGSGANTLKFKVDSATKGCAADSAAPSNVMVTGSATITGGTGKFVGASGTLTVKGGFYVKSTAAGTKDVQAFNATFSGNIKLK